METRNFPSVKIAPSVLGAGCWKGKIVKSEKNYEINDD